MSSRQTLKTMLAQQGEESGVQPTLPAAQYLRQHSARGDKKPPATSRPLPEHLLDEGLVRKPKRVQTAQTSRPAVNQTANGPLPPVVNGGGPTKPTRHNTNGDGPVNDIYKGPYMARMSSAPPTRSPNTEHSPTIVTAGSPREFLATRSFLMDEAAQPENQTPTHQDSALTHATPPRAATEDPEIESTPIPAPPLHPSSSAVTAVPQLPIPPRTGKNGSGRQGSGAIRVGSSPRGVVANQPSALTNALRECNRILHMYEELRLSYCPEEQEELGYLLENCGVTAEDTTDLDVNSDDDRGTTIEDVPRSRSATKPPSVLEGPPLAVASLVSRTSPLVVALEHSSGPVTPNNFGASTSMSFPTDESIPAAMAIALNSMDLSGTPFYQWEDITRQFIPHCCEFRCKRKRMVGQTPVLVCSAHQTVIKPLEHPELNAILQSCEPFEDETHLIYPAVLKDEVVGVLQFSKSEGAVDRQYMFLQDPPTRRRLEVMAANAAMVYGLKNQQEKAAMRQSRSDAMLRMTHILAHDSLNQDRLLKDIMNTVQQLLDADRCAIFTPVTDGSFTAIVEGGKMIRAPKEGSIVGRVAKSLKCERVDDVNTCAHFFRGADRSTGYTTRSVLCAPVMYEGHLVAVAQLINKRPQMVQDVPIECHFTDEDEATLAAFGTFIGLCLRNCHQNTKLLKEKQKVDKIFSALSTIVGSELVDISAVNNAIVESTKIILDHPDDVNVVFFTVDKESSTLQTRVDGENKTFEKIGLAGQVAKTNQVVSLPHEKAVATSCFVSTVDAPALGSIVGLEEVLSVPITFTSTTPMSPSNSANIDTVRNVVSEDVVGVLQLLKVTGDQLNVSGISSPACIPAEGGSSFGEDTIELLQTFAKFAGIWVHHAALLAFTIKAGRAATKLSMGIGNRSRGESISKVLTTAQERLVHEVLNCKLPPDVVASAKTSEFDIFTLFTLNENDPTAQQTAAKLNASRVAFDLIMSTGLPDKFGCSSFTLAAFIVGLRDKYRDVPYHNFFHAVDVLQTVYTFLFAESMVGKAMLEPLEVFTLMITTLSHDVDHMGLNNSFHLKSDSPLGILSSAAGTQSVLEVHHCNVTIELLGTDAMNVFQKLDPDDSNAAFRLLIDCILSTDMAKHRELVEQVTKFEKPFDKHNRDHRRLVCLILMKMGDISNVTKPFDVSKRWGRAVVEEFSAQGDMEKSKGLNVEPMFDRKLNNDLAKSQMGFIDFVTKNFFGTVTEVLLPQLRWVFTRMMENREIWEREQTPGSPK